MRKFLVLRRLTGSDLGWFADARRQGKVRGRQRGINFNAEMLERILGGLPKSRDLAVRTIRHSDRNTQERSIKKQQKNWRLVGDMVSGSGLEWLNEGDFFWCIIELVEGDILTLTWDVLSRRQHSDAHAAITSEFSPQLTGSMRAWEVGEAGAVRLCDLLKLKPVDLGISSSKVTEVFSVAGIQAKNDNPVRHGSATLRPRARLVQAIGEDLISNEIVAVVELIKNAYDADAHVVEIRFEAPLTPGNGAIIVKDDGHGMLLEILQTAWMEPATKLKARTRFSPGGRRMTGEKGLGRFAAARLARCMRVESTAKLAGTLGVVEFNWDDFRNEDGFLDQIQCKWKEFAVSEDAPAGTILIMSGLQDGWNLESFRRLRGELSRLIAKQPAGDVFSIELALPSEFAELSGPITPPPILVHPQYTLHGRLSENGLMAASLGFGSDDARSIREQVHLKGGRVPRCGPFEFDFKIWDRDELGRLALDLGSTIQDIRRDLNEAAGISVYRDQFRVLPYGGSSNDWLRLDIRRVQNPAMRLSNNQVVGAIYITADENPELRDQTNREGIVDSQAFEDLRACVFEIMAQIEKARYVLRRKANKLVRQHSLFEELDLTPVRAAFAAKYPQDQKFIEYLEEQGRRVKESVEQIQEVIVRYRRLATLGQLVDVVLHDGRTSIASISNECELGRRDLGKGGAFAELQAQLGRRLDSIEARAETLSGLFRRISPFSGRKRGRPRKYRLESSISDSFALLHDRIEKSGVKVCLPESSTVIRADEADMRHVMVNLVDNALYWLEKVPRDERQIAVQVRKRDNGIEIFFSDSGPGVPDEVRSLIFDPYFSTKPDGVGLGLTIAGEIVSEYDGTLELVEPGLLSGANFRITLKTDEGIPER
jgi:hypothetical protein